MNRIKRCFRHSRTILAARLYSILGALVALQGAVLPWLMGQDWTPAFTWLLAKVPDGLRPLLVGACIALTGALFEWLRRVTTKALPDKAPSP